MAREVLDRYHELDATGRVAFFEALARDFGPDRALLTKAIETWQAQPGDGNGGLVHFASEPRAQMSCSQWTGIQARGSRPRLHVQCGTEDIGISSDRSRPRLTA